MVGEVFEDIWWMRAMNLNLSLEKQEEDYCYRGRRDVVFRMLYRDIFWYIYIRKLECP